MSEEIYEIRIVHIDNMSESTRAKVIAEVANKPAGFKNKFMGFAKVTWVTASPKRISSVEPIEGSIVQFFDTKNVSGVNIPTF